MAHDKLTPEQDRQRDQGHFNLYGMRDDSRGSSEVDGENRGDGASARRFGARGDESSYANRAPENPLCMRPPPARSQRSMLPARRAAWAWTMGAKRTRRPACRHGRERR